MSIIREFAGFVIRPRYFEHKEKWSKTMVGSLLKLFGLKFVLAIFVYTITTFAFSIFFEKSEMPERWNYEEQSTRYVFMLVVFLPFFEELLFRSWLRKRWGIIFMPPLVLGFLAVTLGLGIPVFSRGSMCFLALAAIVILICMRSERLAEAQFVHRYSDRVFRYVYWGSAIVFGLGHLTNFSTLNDAGLWAVFLVLPQIIGGLTSGFICVRFSFSAAFLMHGFWNGTLVLISFLIT